MPFRKTQQQARDPGACGPRGQFREPCIRGGNRLLPATHQLAMEMRQLAIEMVDGPDGNPADHHRVDDHRIVPVGLPQQRLESGDVPPGQNPHDTVGPVRQGTFELDRPLSYRVDVVRDIALVVEPPALAEFHFVDGLVDQRELFPLQRRKQDKVPDAAVLAL